LLCDFAVFVDITQNLNELNSNPRGTNQLINEMFAQIKTFDSRLRLWELQLCSNNMARSPNQRTQKPADTKKYAEEIRILQQEFSSAFQNF
jgi:hypothetical protein